MTKPIKAPRTDSHAYSALVQLQRDFGGSADTEAWMKAFDYTSMAEFDRLVVMPLLRFRLIRRTGAGVVLADRGLTFLADAGVVQLPELVITPATYVPPMRPLSPRNMPRLAVMRPGALDYLDIPSRFGDERIPHGVKAAA